MTRPAARAFSRLALVAALSVCLIAGRGQDQSDELARADAAFRQGRFVEAAAAYQRVVELEQKSGPARAGLVRSLLRQHRVLEASRAAELGVTAVPGHAPLMAAYGDVCFRLGLFAKAQGLYADALASDGSCARAYLGLAMVDLTERANRRAKDRIERAHRLAPQEPDIFRAWASTMPTRTDRIAVLEQYLALTTNDDAVELEGLRAWVASRKALGDKTINVITDPRRAYRLDLREMLDAKGPVQAYWLQGLVNGQKLRLIVDSGAGGITLNRKAAERCRVAMLSVGAPMFGIGNEGTRATSHALADTVRVGELEIRNREVAVVPGQQIDAADGLIGTDVFGQFLVRLNFPARRLELTPLDTGQKSIEEDYWGIMRQNRPEYTPVRVFGHLLLADTAVNDVPGFLMVIDSGAYGHLLSTTAMAKLTGLSTSESRVTGISGSANETLYTRREMTLRFGNVAQPGRFLSVNLDEQNNHLGVEVAGLIGLDALRLLDVTIDYTNGLVRFEYKP